MSRSTLGLIAACSALSLLSGCVVQPAYVPPPRPVYQPPPAPVYTPPPAYAEPGIEVRVSEAPPPLPDYEQPP